MMSEWNRMIEEHEIAYLRGDLATSSPESYTVQEMKGISDGMAASAAAVEEAMRADFAAMPPELQRRMISLLEQADPANAGWWRRLLLSGEHAAA